MQSYLTDSPQSSDSDGYCRIDLRDSGIEPWTCVLQTCRDGIVLFLHLVFMLPYLRS